MSNKLWLGLLIAFLTLSFLYLLGLRALSPAVCLYLVPSASEDPEPGEVSRTEILDWCLTNQFELVQCDDAEEEEFEEREGEARIISALKAHTWSNLRLEDAASSQPGLPPDLHPGLPTQNSEDDINFESLKNLGLEVSLRNNY